MRILSFLLLLCSTLSYAQLADDFTDGDLSMDPVWSGDVSDFRVNEDFQLQLDAPDAGTSFLYAPVTLTDSTEWELYFDLDFNPSSGNRLRIYLAVDNVDLAIAKGYYLEIGEDGSADAIKLYALDGSDRFLLGSGTMSAVAIDPARARIRIKRTETGEWSLKADYDGGNILVDDLLLMDDQIDISGAQYFGLECTYTSTRADKFFFDDIRIQEPVQDLSPPELVDLTLIDEQTLVLSYDEILSYDTDAAAEISITPGMIAVSSATVSNASPNQLEIVLAEPLLSGTIYTVCSANIIDLPGNASMSQCLETFLAVEPEIGDLYINEILFNPNTGGSDFVEIINVSDKFIQLDRVSILNNQNEQSELIAGGITMRPGEILAFTEDPSFQIATYAPTAPQNILEQELPSFNLDEGNVSLLYTAFGEEFVLDAFDYLDDYHFVLIDNVKGVSLEKINARSPSNDAGSWNSAAEQVGYATPGYRNSSAISTEPQNSEMISLPLEVFSPNEDGIDDLFAIAFNLDQVGYVANVNIYTDRGRLVKNISNNVLLSRESYVYWNGITDEGVLADIGMYVVLVELYDTNGNISSFKESFVLADFLD